MILSDFEPWLAMLGDDFETGLALIVVSVVTGLHACDDKVLVSASSNPARNSEQKSKMHDAAGWWD